VSSIVSRLIDEGFDIEDEHRVSYFQPKTQLYVHLGRAADLMSQKNLLLDREQFSQGEASVPQLILMIRDKGLSAQKQ
jgi:hypothetical protein